MNDDDCVGDSVHRRIIILPYCIHACQHFEAHQSLSWFHVTRGVAGDCHRPVGGVIIPAPSFRTKKSVPCVN